MVEPEPRLSGNFVDTLPAVHTGQSKPFGDPIEFEKRLARQQVRGPARFADVRWARAGGADKVDLRDQDAPVVLLAEDYDPRHQEVDESRAERAREAHCRVIVVPRRHRVQVGLTINLGAAGRSGGWWQSAAANNTPWY